jgi:hypothetical protein
MPFFIRTKGGIRIPNRNIKLDEEGTLNLSTGERVISIMPSELEVRITQALYSQLVHFTVIANPMCFV